MEALAIRQPANEPMELSISEIKAQVQKIQEVMRQVMQKGEHYGVIPGTNKPTLLKAGAEKLCLTFRLDPQYESTEHYDGDHLTIKSKCSLFHIVTGGRIGSGEGSCSTKESKYAYRNAALSCPECGKESIIKGRSEYGGGWLCFGKKGGCGAKFPDDQFEGVEVGKIANDNLADQYNTVLKMSNKRALVAAVLNATAASDIFSQDLDEEDLENMAANGQRKESKANPVKRAQPERAAEINYVAHLGAAIMDFVNNDKKAAKEILKELAGTTELKDLSQTSAKAAQLLFEQKFLSAGTEREPGADDA